MTTTNLVTLPVPYFPDPDTNEPLTSASVYIGEPDTDPTVEGNRITLTLIEQDGTEVAIAAAQQPLQTGAGGVIMYDGSPVAEIQVAQNYSMTVLRSDNTQAYYFPNAGVPSLLSNIQSSTYTYLSNVAGTNALTAEATPSLTGYTVGAVFRLIPGANNTRAVTLNIDGLGVGNVLLKGAALEANTIVDSVPFGVMVTSLTPTFEIIENGAFLVKDNSLASGTRALFIQNTAPTNWTFVSSNDDRVILNTDTVSEGGDTGGSWTVAGFTIGGTTLTSAQSGMPAHTVTLPSGVLTLTSSGATLWVDSDFDGAAQSIYNNGTDPAVSGKAASQSHNHSISQDASWRPAYVKSITCQKD